MNVGWAALTIFDSAQNAGIPGKDWAQPTLLTAGISCHDNGDTIGQTLISPCTALNRLDAHAPGESAMGRQRMNLIFLSLVAMLETVTLPQSTDAQQKDSPERRAVESVGRLTLRGNSTEPANQVSPKDQAIEEIALRILDEKLSGKMGEDLIAKHPDKAAELVVAMTAAMPEDTREEYRRIPWIWRVAVSCGKRNQADQILALLRVSLPRQNQPLHDWQAVVIGGGIVNGIGLSGSWPRSRIDEILRDEPALKSRWQTCIHQSVQMADDEKVPTGTRYDALRIVAMEDSKARREQLTKYLAKGVHDELQMGAISGLSDIETDEAPRVLLENLGHFNDENRLLALDALTRNDFRCEKLLDAVMDGRVPKSTLGSKQIKSLRESKSSSIRERANKVLGE